jgi:hypothetical protein
MSSLAWPTFWTDVPEPDRTPLREVISQLLGCGVVPGDEGSGRDLYLLVRDQYRQEVQDYIAVLGLELLVDSDPPLLQARPVPEECELLETFTKAETLIVLALWRVYDESRSQSNQPAVLLTLNDLWTRWQVYFDRIDPPTSSALREVLQHLRRKKLIRFQECDDPMRPDDAMIEVLPTLPRVIPFDSLVAWFERAALYDPASSESTNNASPTES